MYTAIIVAGGAGKRSGLPYNKVFYELHGKPLIEYVIDRFNEDKDCQEIILVSHEHDLKRMNTQFSVQVDKIVKGGLIRQESVYQGLKEVKSSYVMIHDGSRPFITETMLKRIKNAFKKHDAITCAIPVHDTLKYRENGVIGEDLKRDHIIAIQTPQAFKTEAILKAYESTINDKVYTCDASLYKDILQKEVFIVSGDRRNIKFTEIEDGAMLELVLS